MLLLWWRRQLHRWSCISKFVFEYVYTHFDFDQIPCVFRYIVNVINTHFVDFCSASIKHLYRVPLQMSSATYRWQTRRAPPTEIRKSFIAHPATLDTGWNGVCAIPMCAHANTDWAYMLWTRVSATHTTQPSAAHAIPVTR